MHAGPLLMSTVHETSADERRRVAHSHSSRASAREVTSANFRANETLTLSRASKILTRSWALTLVLAANLNRVFDAQTDPAHLPLHVREQTRVRDLGREPMINFKLLNSVLDERASQGIERKAHDACRGLHLAGGTLLGFCADSERDLRWLWLPLGAPSGLSPSGLGSLKAVTEWVGSRVRDNRSRTAVTSYP